MNVKKVGSASDEVHLAQDNALTIIMSLTSPKHTEDVCKLNQNHLGTSKHMTGEVCAILDTGYNGSAVCSKSWLAEYKKSLCERKMRDSVPRHRVKPIKFTCGMDNVRVSDIETEFPV